MADFAPTWPRENAVPGSGRVAEVFMTVFASGPLRDDVKLQVGRFGVPNKESVQAIDVREHLRSDAAPWFDQWRSGALRNIAESDLGPGGLAELDRADRCLTLEVKTDEPSDLAHLQAVWAYVRFLIARGATTVLDVYAARFFTAAEVGEPGELDLDREMKLIFETDEDEPGLGHIMHTRGMKKFGRPDVVVQCDPADAEILADVVWQLAGGMAQGFLPALPRHGVDLSDDVTLYLVEDAALVERLNLQNDGRVLVDDEGRSPHLHASS